MPAPHRLSAPLEPLAPSAPLPSLVPVLALDTATEFITLGVQVADAHFTRTAAGGAASSARLIPLIHGLMADAGIALRDLRAVAFGRGPGAFTGLRTACAVAQGLGFGLGRPLLPLCSLHIVAEDARAQLVGPMPADATADFAVAMDARMDEVYAARFRWRPGQGWQVLAEPALFTLPALAQAWRDLPPHHVAGSALAAFGTRLPLPARWASHVPAEADRAGALLRLAVHAARTSPGISAAQALPLYLRDKVALTTDERDAARATRAVTTPA